MSVGEILLLAVALSMDAFAVSISNAVAYPHEERRRLFMVPVMFGVFQGICPVIGYYLGSVAAPFIEQFGGIITFVILGWIGTNMVIEGVQGLRAGEVSGERIVRRILTFKLVLIQAVSTSIDALAVGVGLLATGTNLLFAASLIALITFGLCCGAMVLGKRFGSLLGERALIAGGVVLALIGLKSLLF